MHPPDPRAVSLSLSGFVAGVLATLLATGVIARTPRDSTPAVPTVPTPRRVQPSALEQHVRALVLRQLGPSLDGHKTGRLITLRLLPVVDLPAQFQPEGLDTRYRSLFVSFRLNDHPFGRAWRLKAAKGEVFGLLKGLYTSGLPIYNTELVGRFPLRQGGATRPTNAMTVYISYSTATRIPWRRWGRDREAQLWNELNYKVVRPGFG